MGVCASCLGLGRRSSDAGQPSDSTHLLADSYPQHYGSLDRPGSRHARQPDPEEIRRQRDALERICAQTSDKLIHVSHAPHAADGSRVVSEYPRLFNERFATVNAASDRPPSAKDSDDDEDESAWLEHVAGQTADAEGPWERVEPTEPGALTIQFGEPLSSDKRPLR